MRTESRVRVAALPPERVTGCVVYAAAEIAAPGVSRPMEGTRSSTGRPAGAERAGHHRASTLRDRQRGRPPELDVIPAAVVELAGRTGARVPTPRAIDAVADLANRNIVETARSADVVRDVAGS